MAKFKNTFITGDLSVTGTGTFYSKVYSLGNGSGFYIGNNTYTLGLHMDSTTVGLRGLYDYNLNKYLIYANKDGYIGLNGNADTASTASNAAKLGTATVGGTAKPVYLNGGAPATLTTIGSNVSPVYLNKGVFTPIDEPRMLRKTGQWTWGSGWTGESLYCLYSRSSRIVLLNFTGVYKPSKDIAAYTAFHAGTISEQYRCGGAAVGRYYRGSVYEHTNGSMLMNGSGEVYLRALAALTAGSEYRIYGTLIYRQQGNYGDYA
jgi:hypothetical protein